MRWCEVAREGRAGAILAIMVYGCCCFWSNVIVSLAIAAVVFIVVVFAATARH